MIEFRTLGGLSLTRPDGREPHALLARPKPVALLAYLAQAPPLRLVRRDTLLALFWPEADVSHARAALRKAVYVLRASLGDAVLVSRGDDELGVNRREIWCDAAAFGRALDAGQMEEALAIYHGEMLPGFFISDAPAFEEWLEGERARLAQRAAEAASTLAASAETRGELSLAAHWGRRALALSRDEGVLRRLITVLDRLGDRASALRLFEQFARQLATEYDMEPSSETVSLAATIRARTTRPPTSTSKRPSFAGRYEIEGEIARGGIVITVAARDQERGRRVLLKVVRPELASVLDVEAFTRALEPAVRLRHPNIVSLEAVGANEGVVYYVTAAVDGESLRARLARQRELPVAEAIRVVRDVADALDCAHSHGVLHHELKPSRVVVGNRPAAVTDIGVAPAVRIASASDSLTSTGFALGTPGYTAPELAMADPQSDHRADIYALGAIAYTLLTGETPVGGTSPQEVFAAQVLAKPVPVAVRRSAVPPALASVVMACLEKRPADRPQTAAEVRDALVAPGERSGQ
ncbi:MAG TPA: protein kinase [Gemmatimonadaceae bacterium]|nr:protein kinase [Gemmatimonadaceae bacterium]